MQVNFYQATNVLVVAERHADRLCECPAQGKSCNKCGRLHHFESVYGMIPSRRSQSRPGKAVNKLNQNNSLTSFPRNSEHVNFVNTVPKQVLDVVNLVLDVVNSGVNSSKNLQHHVELDTLSASGQSQEPVVSTHTNVFKQKLMVCLYIVNKTLVLKLMQCH